MSIDGYEYVYSYDSTTQNNIKQQLNKGINLCGIYELINPRSWQDHLQGKHIKRLNDRAVLLVKHKHLLGYKCIIRRIKILAFSD